MLNKQKLKTIYKIAKNLNIKNIKKYKKKKLIKKILNFNNNIIVSEGVLEIIPNNYGFLRSSDFNYITSPDDIYVSKSKIKLFGMKTGDTIKCEIRAPKKGEKFFPLIKVIKINGCIPSYTINRYNFDNLIPLFPNEKFNLSGKNSTIATRIIDLFTPIGKGQRALIVAPPKAGKTKLMKDFANCIDKNHSEVYQIILLIDERPEEVTEMKNNVNGEVIFSTFDEKPEKHVKVANLVLKKSMRMVECGHDVVILLDSITRLARAYNNITPTSGRILSGGIDSKALHKPKKFFGSARNIEKGGSLTIIATAMIDTGSKMDNIIFEEFKGTGNMELQLSRKIANKRIFPAIDLINSSTRREELLLNKYTLKKMSILRNYLSEMNSSDAIKLIINQISNTKSNKSFLKSIRKRQ